jgi:hypothetical protein
MGVQDHQFDRRTSDVNVEALSVLVRGLTGRVEVLEEQGRTTARSLDELKPLAQEVHAAVFGVEGEFPGLASMQRDVHAALFGSDGKPGAMTDIQVVRDLLETGRKAGSAIHGAATGAGKFSDGVSRALRRFWWLIAAAAAVITYLKTGKWPDVPIFPQ